MKTSATTLWLIIVTIFATATLGRAAEAKEPGSFSGIVYYDNNGNGVQDAGEPVAPNVALTMTIDHFQPETRAFTSGQDGSFRIENLYPEMRVFGWTLCPADANQWWITAASGSSYRPDLEGCPRIQILSGENVSSIGVQDMAAQSVGAATLTATGFADHNRDGVEQAGETPFSVETQLLLTGPTPNGTRYSVTDSRGVMRWGPVFAPATGYAWTVCVPRPTGLDPERYEITSVTPGGSPAENGCWNLTIAPGENTLVFGFYDRLQPEGTPTPTMTATPEPTPVPLGMRMVIDCDPSQAGVQSSCDVTLGSQSNVGVDVLLINDSAGEQHMVAAGVGVQTTDRARLYPPPFPVAGVTGNPDVNPALPAAGFACNPPWNEINGDGISYFGCYSGTSTIAIPQGSTLRLATVHYVVPAAATPGAVTLALANYPEYSAAGFIDYYCPADAGGRERLSACTGAIVTLLAPATATPTPTATLTVTATPAQSALVQSTSTPRPASANAAASSARVVNQVNPAVAGGVAPVVATPGVAVLGASIRPPDAGDGAGASREGGTWGAVAVLLGLAGCGAVAAAWRRGAARR